MKRSFIGLLRGVLLLAFLQGQLVFAAPVISSLMGSECGPHMDMSSTDPNHGQHHAHSHSDTQPGDGQHAEHQACLGGDVPCDHSCKGDSCCSGCGVCGHCSIVLVAASRALVPIAGYQSCGVSLPLQEPYPSTIFQPPRSLSQS
jgi:hypothetical protein